MQLREDLLISLEMEYAPVWHQICDRSKKSGDIKSSIIEHVISVIQIKSKHLGNVSQDKKHDSNQMQRNVDLDEWLHGGSTEGSS